MSIWLQVGAGLLPALLILLLYLIMIRRNIVSSLLLFLMLTGGVSLCAFHGKLPFGNAPETVSWKAQSADSHSAVESTQSPLGILPPDETIRIIYGLAAQKHTDEASEMLKGFVADHGYDVSCALAQARISAASGDFAAAKVLYEKAKTVWDDSAAKEFDAVAAACTSQSIDTVLLAHMDSADITGLYPEAAQTAGDTAQAADLVLERLEQAGADGDTDYTQLSQILASTQELYDSFLTSGEKDDSRIRSLEEDLVEWEIARPEVFSLQQVREARMRLQILQGDYTSIAADLTDESDYHEIMIASELYLNGYVKKSDFTGSYAQADDESLRVVTNQLRQIQNNGDDQIGRRAGELLDVYKNYKEDAPMYRMEQNLLNCTNERGFTDSSKVYLQTAKMELEKDREDKAKEYIGLAMDTAADCEDPEYTGPMYQIMGIMANKDEAESLKDVALYTDNVLNNQLEIVLPETTAAASVQTQFSGYMTDYVSMQRSAVNISSLDPSGFDQITAYVQIETPVDYQLDELKNYISVEDCGIQITDYTLEKVEYNSANMLLCCDVSGSMEGRPIEDSKAAVVSMADSMTGNARLGVILFNNTVQSTTNFTVQPDIIRSAAESMTAHGGTNIFDTVVQGLNSFPNNGPEVLNTLVVMSDGQEGNLHSPEDIQTAIGDAAQGKSILVHCLGLGSEVDANYLQTIAQSAGGTYQYVTDSSSLAVFYQNLASQKNYTYKLQYRAVDTLSVDRELKVILNDSNYLYDIKAYTLPGVNGSSEDEQNGQHDLVYKDGLSIQGLDTRLLFKSVNPAAIHLMGTGFKEDDSITVKMMMNNNGTHGLTYDIVAQYTDEKSFTLTIPSSVACGAYDLKVTIRGKTVILDNELTIQVQGSERTTVFGPYSFTSYQKQTVGDSTILNGYVTLNNWLCFKGQVTLKGALDHAQIQMENFKGCYIRYYSGRSKGLAEFMRSHNMTLQLPPLGTLTLYNDIKHNASDDDYLVDIGSVPLISFPSTFDLNTLRYSLYPDRITIKAKALSTHFPGQDTIYKSVSSSMFEFSVEELGGILTPDNIGFTGDFKVGDEEKENYYPAKLLSLQLYLHPNGEFKLNTLKNEYELTLSTSVLFFKDQEKLGFSVKWENNIMPTKIMLMLPFKKTVLIQGIPVTFKNFEVGVEDLDIKNWLSLTLVGKMDASACSLSDIIPQPIADFFGRDKSLITLADSTLRLNIKRMEAETTVKVLKDFDIGHILLQVGNFSYTNQLLSMDDEDVWGLNGEVKRGIGFENDNCTIAINGTINTSLTNRFIGFKGDGDCHIQIGWWIFVEQFNQQGMATIGYFVDHDGDGALTVRYKGYLAAGKVRQFSVDLSKDGLYMNQKKFF